VESLTKEIRERQQIIEDNVEINEIKNAKIFKEMRKLRDEN
jgi:hypothetical protein